MKKLLQRICRKIVTMAYPDAVPLLSAVTPGNAPFLSTLSPDAVTAIISNDGFVRMDNGVLTAKVILTDELRATTVHATRPSLIAGVSLHDGIVLAHGVFSSGDVCANFGDFAILEANKANAESLAALPDVDNVDIPLITHPLHT